LTKKVDAVQNVNLKILGVKEMTTSEIRKELEKLKGEIVTIKNTLEYIENQVQWNIGA
jgi:SOS response regulatory protein OraA/RecX